MEKEKKKIKMMPTLREKRHYLVLKAETKKQIDDKKIKEIINKAILRFIGILGYANAGPLFVEIKNHNKKTYVILSVTTKYVDHVKAAIALISKPFITCVGVSGTIKKSKRFLK